MGERKTGRFPPRSPQSGSALKTEPATVLFWVSNSSVFQWPPCILCAWLSISWVHSRLETESTGAGGWGDRASALLLALEAGAGERGEDGAALLGRARCDSWATCLPFPPARSCSRYRALLAGQAGGLRLWGQMPCCFRARPAGTGWAGVSFLPLPAWPEPAAWVLIRVYY